MPDAPYVLGAGPAGLSAAFKLAQAGVPSTILERHGQVGGLCRTLIYKGARFDVGPHRFFTKNEEVNQLWQDLLGEDRIRVKRLTRILYNQTFFEYPLKPMSALRGLGPVTSARAMLSYAGARFRRHPHPPVSFEDWVVRKFGKTLYQIFFKTYTEKVWGIPCSNISAAWATQRIKGLNLGQAVLHALAPSLNRRGRVKSLVDEFDYPRLGSGQVYEKMAERSVAGGSRVLLEHTVRAIGHENRRITRLEVATPRGEETHPVSHVFSSIPLTEFVLKLAPPPPEEVLAAARALYYRDHITVCLIIRRPRPFPDNWIYVHSPEVRMARISSYGNFSPHMPADPNQDAIAVEYFVFAHEDLWHRNDRELIDLARAELAAVSLLAPEDVVDGFVIRERDSYPTYYLAYEEQLEIIKNYLRPFANLTLIGRGGMYRYNNQDHSILSGRLAAANYLGGNYNLWEINEEQEYLEEKQIPLPYHAGPAAP
jgi:protoporphyrinogen oxidase